MIYHITTIIDWKNALINNTYTHESLAIEKFIHASTILQVQETLNRYYNKTDSIIILGINETKLTNKLIFELSPNMQQEFPHIYGNINIEAVEKIFGTYKNIDGNNCCML